MGSAPAVHELQDAIEKYFGSNLKSWNLRYDAHPMEGSRFTLDLAVITTIAELVVNNPITPRIFNTIPGYMPNSVSQEQAWGMGTIEYRLQYVFKDPGAFIDNLKKSGYTRYSEEFDALIEKELAQ